MIKLEEIKHGAYVTCTIESRVIKKARISIERGTAYVCQDKISGSGCSEKFRFRHSWSIGSIDGLIHSNLESEAYFDRYIRASDVRKLELVDTEWNTEENSA